MTSDYPRMRELSAQIFRRALFLPVAAWVFEHRRDDIHFSDLRSELLRRRITASKGPLSEELGELERLGMITRGRRRGKYVPYHYEESELWKLIQLARRLDWHSTRRRRGRRR